MKCWVRGKQDDYADGYERKRQQVVFSKLVSCGESDDHIARETELTSAA
jgi:hypothetical protein